MLCLNQSWPALCLSLSLFQCHINPCLWLLPSHPFLSSKEKLENYLKALKHSHIMHSLFQGYIFLLTDITTMFYIHSYSFSLPCLTYLFYLLISFFLSFFQLVPWHDIFFMQRVNFLRALKSNISALSFKKFFMLFWWDFASKLFMSVLVFIFLLLGTV